MNETYTFGDSMLERNEIIEKIRECIIHYRNNEYLVASEELDKLEISEEDEYLPLLHHFRALIDTKLPAEETTGNPPESGDKELDDHLKKVEVWCLHIDELASNSSSFAKEILVVSQYRYYRAYNEAYEHILLSSGQPKIGERYELKSNAIDDFSDDSQVERSEHWRKIVFFDSAQKHEKRLFRKSYDEFHILKTNEKIVFDGRRGVTHQYDTYKTTSLDGFFSNEIPYLVSSLRKRLEDMFPSGVDEDRKYIRCWERARSANDKSADEEATDEELFDSFDEYCKGVRRLSVYMKMILECHQKGKGFDVSPNGVFRNKIIEDERGSIRLTGEGIRFHTFLEVTYLHNLIAVDVAESIYFQKQLENFCSSFLKTRRDESAIYAKRRTFLRTNNWHDELSDTFESGHNFVEWLLSQRKPEEKSDPFFYQRQSSEGRAFALLMLWFYDRTLPGLFLALSSNGFKGDLIAGKTERNLDSSVWGEKVILKNGTKYIQLCQRLHHKKVKTTRINLSSANRFFNVRKSAVSDAGKVTTLDSSFMTATFEFPKILGETLQDQWYRECERYTTTENLSYVGKLSVIIMEYFLSISHKTKLTEPLSDLNYPGESEGLRHPKPNEGMTYWFLEWVHGDEWGGNFTVHEQRLYAIDLEDCVKNHYIGDKTKASVGGNHAERFVPKGTLPQEMFCAIASAGRLIAALCQKTVFDMRGKGLGASQELCNALVFAIKRGIDANIEANPEINEYDEAESLNYQFWHSFFGWLRYWTHKETAINRQNKFLDEEVNLFQIAYESAYSSQSEEDE